MKPKVKPSTNEQPLFGVRLELMLDPNHELVKLAQVIDWDALTAEFGPLYAETGRPGVPIRTMAGLVLLQHTFKFSDEEVVARWIENPYWQRLCGEEFFQHRFPVNPSQLSRWRKRIGPEGCEKLLKLTIDAGLASKTVQPKSFEKVIVDTTVQIKAVAHPTDARLYHKALNALVRIAKKSGVELRQSHTRLSKYALVKYGQYRKAKQFKRAKKEQRKLKTYTGRVHRDLERNLSEEAWEANKGTMILTELLLTQKRTTKGKVYSIHAPEVECIAKGKAHKPYEFGVKVSLATTLKEGFVVGMQSCPGNPYDGHTLADQLDQVARLTGRMPKRAHVDKGYKGHGVASETCQVLISGARRGIDKPLAREMKRRAAVEPEIGHQKSDGKLDRNHLKGSQGDAMSAFLCGAGHNLRKILARLRQDLYAWVAAWVGVIWQMATNALGCPQAA
jgi:IS5 family transposase